MTREVFLIKQLWLCLKYNFVPSFHLTDAEWTFNLPSIIFRLEHTFTTLTPTSHISKSYFSLLPTWCFEGGLWHSVAQGTDTTAIGYMMRDVINVSGHDYVVDALCLFVSFLPLFPDSVTPCDLVPCWLKKKKKVFILMEVVWRRSFPLYTNIFWTESCSLSQENGFSFEKVIWSARKEAFS